MIHALRHLIPDETRGLRDGDGSVLGLLSLGCRPLLWEGEPTPYVEVVAAGRQGEGVGRELMLSAEALRGLRGDG